jgi:SpoIVB peptidase S55
MRLVGNIHIAEGLRFRSRAIRCLSLAAAIAACAASLAAGDAPDIFPLDQVKPGMTGVAYTIFAGDQIESMDLDVIGVMPNFMGPKQDIILVRLKGPKVEHTGVVAGMSGSPVFIEGKLAGALSLKLGAFSKEPLAGVTPIESMLAVNSPAAPSAPASANAGDAAPQTGQGVDQHFDQHFDLPEQWASARAGSGDQPDFLEPIAAPVVSSGFSAESLRQYSDQFAQFGLESVQGGSAAARPDDAKIVPGDMIGVALIDGDLSMNAACTVTMIVGDRIYACGHPIFGFGSISLPMTRARVLTTLASEYESTKIVNVGGVIGTIDQDFVSEISGHLGATAAMIPVELELTTPAGKKVVHFEVASNPKLTPILVGLATLNGLTQNAMYSEGTTLRLSANIDIEDHPAVQLESMFAPSDALIPDGAYAAAAVQTAFAQIFSNPYEIPRIRRIHLSLESLPDHRSAAIASAWADKTEAVPGEAVVVKVLLHPYRGAAVIRDIPITIPPQAAPGTTMQILVSDSTTLDRRANPFGAAGSGRLNGLDQLIAMLNRERRDNTLYVALLDNNPTLLVEDSVLPNAPLDEIDVLDGRPGTSAALTLHDSAAGEWSVPMEEVVSGSTTISIRIR